MVETPADWSDFSSRAYRTKAAVRFYICQWPDFYSVMNECDREFYQWIEQVPENLLPMHILMEKQRIANASGEQQYQQWLSCESGRQAGRKQPETGLRLTVTSKLTGGRIERDDSASAGMSARLTVPFAAGFSPPPTPCPPIPFHYLHKVDRVGINYYPQNTVVEFTGQTANNFDGIGPWEGCKVLSVLHPEQFEIRPEIFSHEARVRSQKVFDHWVIFRAIDNPNPPASLVARSEPFDPGSLDVDTNPFDRNFQDWQVGWRIFVEYTHVDSGQSWVFEIWLNTLDGWSRTGLGGYDFDRVFPLFSGMNFSVPGGPDGNWRHRVCVYDFKRPPSAFLVRYRGDIVETGVSAISPVATTPYVPGVSTGIANVTETVMVRTVGATKASFRIVGVEPVPGIGVMFTLKVVNELHVPACVVTTFLSGNDDAEWPNYERHYYMPDVYVVRNLDAQAESEPISIILPIDISEPGDWPMYNRHWNSVVSYAAPLGLFPDGIYGIRYDNHGNPTGAYPDIAYPARSAYMVSSDPEQYAELLAGYPQNGDKAWVNFTGSMADPDRLLVMLPLRKAPGQEVPYVRDPLYTNPSFFDQAPFRGFFEWAAEYLVSSNPEVWESRSGQTSIGLELSEAIARYGRTLTVNVSDGRPMWSPYYQRWIAVFEAWSGGDVSELETYLVDAYLRPQYSGQNWRNFQYTTLKPPYLTITGGHWFESNGISDMGGGSIRAVPLIKQVNSADTVDVMLMGSV